MSATMVGRRRKIKKALAKTSQSCPQKRYLDQNINDSKYHIWNSFFENVISGIRFYIRLHVPVNIIRVFFFFQIFQKKFSFLTMQFFQQTCFCLLSEKTFAPHHFLKPKSRILEANVCVFLLISVRKFLFQRRSKVLSNGDELGRGEAEQFP